MSEYIVKLPTYGAADEFFKTHEMPDMTLYGYPLTGEIVRCRDCKHATISTMGVCKYCEMFVLPDTDGYGADPQVNLPLDFFCAWGERRERESAEVWNQWSADDVTCSEES